MKTYVKIMIIAMQECPKKIIKYNHGEKSMKIPFHSISLRIFALKNQHCYNNLKKLSTTKINEHTASGYSLITQSPFDATKNKLDCCRAEDYMKGFCRDLKERATEIINYEKKRNDIINK